MMHTSSERRRGCGYILRRCGERAPSHVFQSPDAVPNQRAPLRAWLKSLPAGSRIGLESTGDCSRIAS